MTTPTEPRSAARRPGGLSVRTRILAATLIVVALALCAILLVTGKSLFTRIDAATARELEHEAAKFRAYAAEASGPDRAAFPDAGAVLTGFLSQNVTEAQESQFSIVDGRPDRRSHAEPPARLDTDRRFVAHVAAVTEPTSGRIETDAGPAMYSAIPVTFDGDPNRGVLVTVEFLGVEQREAWSTVVIMATAAAFALLLAAWAGWLVAGRALAPIRQVRETAAEIDDAGDLGRRIEITGTDDAAQLAVSFNRMLDRLQSAFDGQRRFLDDAGHELRTPVTVIRGHLELMGEDPQERAQTLRLVGDELQRMSRLIDDLILLARAERPDFVQPAPVDVTDLVIETLAKATALGERAWSLDAVPEGTAVVDGQRLTQALLQLAANAVGHTEKGEVVAIGGVLHRGGLSLWVRDEGSGIAEEDHARIFERFVRGGTARRGTGTGVGLAIVARIAAAHGGTVSLRSRPGAGSTFTVDMPAHDEEHR